MTVSKRRFRGQALATARQLFGVPWGKMERKEDRESVALVLRLSPNPRMQMLASQALDPLFKHTSFAKLAENLGLNYHSLSTEFKEIKRSEGFIRAAQHLPEIMEQVALDSKSTWQKCRTCEGTGEAMEGKGDDARPVVCAKCNGKGQVYVLGDVDRLKLTLEMFQLTGKGGGLNVNLDLRQPPAANESMSALSESIAPILDGTVVSGQGPKEEE